MFPQIVAGTVFLYCAVVIAADDYTFRIVPDRILAILFTTGALYELLAKDNFGEDFENTISGLALRSAIPGLSALLLALIYKFARGRDGLGLGDIKLIAAAGIWLPVLGSFYAIALASITALAGALAIALWRRRTATLLDSLPFAVFLAPAFWLLWLLQETGVLPALS
jgi:leader peptidase (prepilin peptidase) / N-methyltransferase